MDIAKILLDTDVLGYLDPMALVVIWALVQAIKRFDHTLSQVRAEDAARRSKSSNNRRRRKDDHGRARAFYPFLPFIVAGVWFSLMSVTGQKIDAQQMILDIGGHGAFAGSGYAILKRFREQIAGRSR